MTMRDDYEKKLRAKLDEWNAEIRKWQAKARAAQADAEIESRRQLERMKEQRDEIEADLEKMRQAGDKSWKDMRAGVEQAWGEMEKAFKAARSRFG